jgi:glycerol kinase
MALLPEVGTVPPTSARPGRSVRREIPILGVAGDQQAATIGQACFSRA